MKRARVSVVNMASVMIDIDAKVDKTDITNLETAVDLMVKGTNRDLRQSVTRASIVFLQSGKANTAIAKGKNRKIRGSGNNKFYAVHHQHKKMDRIMIPQGRRKEAVQRRRELRDKWQKKPRVGTAKASWNRAFSDLGKRVSTQIELRQRALMAVSRAKKLGGKFTPAVNITNGLNYLLKVSPNVEREALQKAGNKLLKNVLEGIEKRNARWR